MSRSAGQISNATADCPSVGPPMYQNLGALEAAFVRLQPLPLEVGRVALIVCRPAPGVHNAVERAILSPECGVPGDEWNRRPPLNPQAQITVMRHDIAQLVCNGQALTLPGDNLLVKMDISSANLPVGTRLQVGEALVEVSPKPHNGCAKFAARFGTDALRFVNDAANRHHNLRGIYWQVITAGEVRVGSEVRVLSRPEIAAG